VWGDCLRAPAAQEERFINILQYHGMRYQASMMRAADDGREEDARQSHQRENCQEEQCTMRFCLYQFLEVSTIKKCSNCSLPAVMREYQLEVQPSQ
jgi:hypothetical protein